LTAFFVRVAAESDRIERQLQNLADTAQGTGLDAVARALRDAAKLLSRLAFDAAGDSLGDDPFNRVADETHLAHRTCMEAASAFRDAMLVTAAREVERCALALRGLNLDTLTQTQPIDPDGGDTG